MLKKYYRMAMVKRVRNKLLYLMTNCVLFVTLVLLIIRFYTLFLTVLFETILPV